MKNTAESAAKLHAKGRIADASEAVLARITPVLDLEQCAGGDICIETVVEELQVKQGIFRALERLARPTAILASNTSTIPIGKIAAATSCPHAPSSATGATRASSSASPRSGRPLQ